ncbi:hypothetical protein T492DRAFT_849045 [Pavlovales sp. CCMP2436]|nr:hypothetical protein T492DRAFT_849045 [Pavlovales sp. CCMP2436]
MADSSSGAGWRRYVALVGSADGFPLAAGLQALEVHAATSSASSNPGSLGSAATFVVVVDVDTLVAAALEAKDSPVGAEMKVALASPELVADANEAGRPPRAPAALIAKLVAERLATLDAAGQAAKEAAAAAAAQEPAEADGDAEPPASVRLVTTDFDRYYALVSPSNSFPRDADDALALASAAHPSACPASLALLCPAFSGAPLSLALCVLPPAEIVQMAKAQPELFAPAESTGGKDGKKKGAKDELKTSADKGAKDGKKKGAKDTLKTSADKGKATAASKGGTEAVPIPAEAVTRPPVFEQLAALTLSAPGALPDKIFTFKASHLAVYIRQSPA